LDGDLIEVYIGKITQIVEAYGLYKSEFERGK